MKNDDSATSNWFVAATATFDFLSDSYQQLYARSRASAFQSPFWLDLLYSQIASRVDCTPLIISVHERASGRLIAVFPLIIHRIGRFRIAEFADFGVTDYCMPIVDDGLDTARLDRSLRHEIDRALRGCSMVIARKVTQHSLPSFELLGAPQRVQLAIHAHAVDLRGSFDAWRSDNISGSQRRFFDTKRRKLRAKGRLEVEVLNSADAMARAIQCIRTFRTQRSRPGGYNYLLNNETFLTFYLATSRSFPTARAYIMTFDGQPISAAYGIEKSGVFHLLLTGFDFNGYRNYSVGLLLIEDAIRDCINRGEKTFDFTIGDQAYKKEFGTAETPMWSVMHGIDIPGRCIAFLLAKWPGLFTFARRFFRDRAAVLKSAP